MRGTSGGSGEREHIKKDVDENNTGGAQGQGRRQVRGQVKK